MRRWAGDVAQISIVAGTRYHTAHCPGWVWADTPGWIWSSVNFFVAAEYLQIWSMICNGKTLHLFMLFIRKSEALRIYLQYLYKYSLLLWNFNVPGFDIVMFWNVSHFPELSPITFSCILSSDIFSDNFSFRLFSATNCRFKSLTSPWCFFSLILCSSPEWEHNFIQN